jgi:hypothetical protein
MLLDELLGFDIGQNSQKLSILCWDLSEDSLSSSEIHTL